MWNARLRARNKRVGRWRLFAVDAGAPRFLTMIKGAHSAVSCCGRQVPFLIYIWTPRWHRAFRIRRQGLPLTPNWLAPIVFR